MITGIAAGTMILDIKEVIRMENVFEGMLARAHENLNRFERNEQAEKIKRDIVEASQNGRSHVVERRIPNKLIDDLKEEGFEVYPYATIWTDEFKISWA